jgi:hypothetical protein
MAVRSNEVQLTELQKAGRSDAADARRTTPAERLQMMWQLTLDAWTFKGEPLAELRLPRHVVRVLRRES